MNKFMKRIYGKQDLHLLTWFRSDIRKSSLDPGNPNSMKVFTRRKSALFPVKCLAAMSIVLALTEALSRQTN